MSSRNKAHIMHSHDLYLRLSWNKLKSKIFFFNLLFNFWQTNKKHHPKNIFNLFFINIIEVRYDGMERGRLEGVGGVGGRGEGRVWSCVAGSEWRRQSLMKFTFSIRRSRVISKNTFLRTNHEKLNVIFSTKY